MRSQGGPAVDFVAGEVVGSYRLVRHIGAGGTAQVWLGRHTVGDGVAAVKILRADRPERHRQLSVEARAIARLAHPHVVRLFEVGSHHLAAAWVDGGDLARRLREPIRPSLALSLVRQIAAALAHAHSLGIIHRDVKPANVLVDRRDTAYLADFGTALFIDESEAGRVQGTPGYMAPEQAAGGRVGPTADQWALARTALALFAGQIEGDTASSLARLGHLPPALASALTRALSPNPDDRFPSVALFAEALSAVRFEDGDPAPQRRERRPNAPFAWAPHALCEASITPTIARADYRLSELEATGALPTGTCADFHAATGHTDFGWSVYGADVLGCLTAPTAAASAGQLVVLMHGWLCTRQVWADVAAAICRDSPSSLVLAPDVAGFGESTLDEASAPLHTTTVSPALAVSRWLALLGLDRLLVLRVGHSLSALALMAEEGADGRRVLLTPYLILMRPFARWMMRLLGRLVHFIGASPLAYRLVLRTAQFLMLTLNNPGLSDEAEAAMRSTFMSMPAGVLGSLVANLGRVRFTRTAIDGAVLLLGTRDPSSPERLVKKALTTLGTPSQVRRIATGGHYPHLPSADHPEWTAQNQDDLVRVIVAGIDELHQSPAVTATETGG